MTLELPSTANEVVNKGRTDVVRSLGGNANPSLENSWLNSLVVAQANGIFDFYIQLNQAITLSFIDTTFGEHLDRWASIWGISRLAATQSTGNVVATGTLSTNIPAGTTFQSTDGITYDSLEAVAISASSLSVASLVRVGDIVTVTTEDDHGIASNIPVTIVDAVPTDYNGAQEITVNAANQFQYSISGTPVTPATGTILAEFLSATVPVQSVQFESSDQTVNQPLDAVLTIGSPIAGINGEANVDFGELGGGTAQEEDDDLRARLLDRVQNPVAHFNVSDIVSKAKTVNGVTRVFVLPVTPAPGQVTIYFMRDNDDDPIPDASEITAVTDVLLEILPANTAEIDMIVDAPTSVVVDFTFSTIFPDTLTMQSAIIENLEQFFQEGTDVGVTIDEDKYRAAIINTIDLDTGFALESFSLNTPSGDIGIDSGEIGTLGEVVF